MISSYDKLIALRQKFSYILVLITFLMLHSISVDAQSPVDSTAIVHSVKKATILSAILPGAGQVYNRKAWKVPIIYAAFAGMGYLIKTNNDNFHKYNDALIARQDNDPNTVDTQFQNVYTDENLNSLQAYYRKNRDLSIIVTALIYVLNIVDAHVDAHLYSFDVGDNLSFKLDPMIQTNPMQQYNTVGGLALHVGF
jgi:hypothetical protein